MTPARRLEKSDNVTDGRRNIPSVDTNALTRSAIDGAYTADEFSPTRLDSAKKRMVGRALG
jgi:hypothetical protein